MADLSDDLGKSEEPIEVSEPKLESPSNGKLKLDPSILIALFAVLISTVSAFISLKESNIMRKQQEILAEQQEASVWPFVECTTRSIWGGDNLTADYSFWVLNKGVGPAIIDSVTYFLDGKQISPWGLGNALADKYPFAKITKLGNSTLNQNVLAPGDESKVIAVKIELPPNDSVDINFVINDFDFHLEFCYCSVYGKCWKVKGLDKYEKSNDCVFRENIR